jgi:hypothetical protein
VKDEVIAQVYLQKIQSAEDRGISFELSLMSFINLMRAKRCAYTGVMLADGPGLPTSRTIERIDNKKGYVKGNVCTVSYSANSLKAVWENPKNHLNIDSVEAMIKKIKAMG